VEKVSLMDDVQDAFAMYQIPIIHAVSHSYRITSYNNACIKFSDKIITGTAGGPTVNMISSDDSDDGSVMVL